MAMALRSGRKPTEVANNDGLQQWQKLSDQFGRIEFDTSLSSERCSQTTRETEVCRQRRQSGKGKRRSEGRKKRHVVNQEEQLKNDKEELKGKSKKRRRGKKESK